MRRVIGHDDPHQADALEPHAVTGAAHPQRAATAHQRRAGARTLRPRGDVPAAWRLGSPGQGDGRNRGRDHEGTRSEPSSECTAGAGNSTASWGDVRRDRLWCVATARRVRTMSGHWAGPSLRRAPAPCRLTPPAPRTLRAALPSTTSSPRRPRPLQASHASSCDDARSCGGPRTARRRRRGSPASC